MQTFRLRSIVVKDGDALAVRIGRPEAEAMGLRPGDTVEVAFEPDPAVLDRIPPQ